MEDEYAVSQVSCINFPILIDLNQLKDLPTRGEGEGGTRGGDREEIERKDNIEKQ
jgi:hypothetical protein